MATAADRHVVVLGASARPSRYSNQAVGLLKAAGFTVTPVSTRPEPVHGLHPVLSLDRVPGRVETVTLYVGPTRLDPMIEALLRLEPKRVIFNPGTESARAEQRLVETGIETVHGCTLVMLKTGQF